MKKEDFLKIRQYADKIKASCMADSWDSALDISYLVSYKMALVIVWKILCNEFSFSESDMPALNAFEKEELEEEVMNDSFFFLSDEMGESFYTVLQKTGWQINCVEFSLRLKGFLIEKGLCNEYDDDYNIPVEQIEPCFHEFIMELEKKENFPFREKGMLNDLQSYFLFDVEGSLKVTNWLFFENDDIGLVRYNLSKYPELKKNRLVRAFIKEEMEISSYACVYYPTESNTYGKTYLHSYITGYCPNTGEEVTEICLSPAVLIHFALMHELMKQMKKELPVLFTKGGFYEKAV